MHPQAWRPLPALSTRYVPAILRALPQPWRHPPCTLLHVPHKAQRLTSAAARSPPLLQPQSAATAQDDVPSRRRRAVVVNLALSACPLSGMASDGLFSQLVDAAADHGMDRLAAALPCVALPLAGLLWSQQLMGCMQPVQRPQAQEPALMLA